MAQTVDIDRCWRLLAVSSRGSHDLVKLGSSCAFDVEIAPDKGTFLQGRRRWRRIPAHTPTRVDTLVPWARGAVPAVNIAWTTPEGVRWRAVVRAR